MWLSTGNSCQSTQYHLYWYRYPYEYRVYWYQNQGCSKLVSVGVAPQLPPRRHYLTVYSTVKGTLRTQKALRRSEEMDLFFLGPTTGQRAVMNLMSWVLQRHRF
eukprot:COSAG02_NODE_7134_length_3164_cov_160.927569_3_plen_104_part_00